MIFKLTKPSVTEVSKRTNYESECGYYRLTKVVFIIGGDSMPVVWQACWWKGRWLLLAGYRARSSAEKCCRLHEKTRQIYVPPKRKKKTPNAA